MKTFKYFLECYFHSGTNYDELEKITEMFKKEEKPHVVQALIEELTAEINSHKWDEVQAKIKEVGMRAMSMEKTKFFVNFLLKKLVE